MGSSHRRDGYDFFSFLFFFFKEKEMYHTDTHFDLLRSTREIQLYNNGSLFRREI